ncbi:hypothetical protein I3760_05G113700 [Carya illinoinensis]|nr:hypothetical protein I3760_05G113700 [Carya illinoinensis]
MAFMVVAMVIGHGGRRCRRKLPCRRCRTSRPLPCHRHHTGSPRTLTGYCRNFPIVPSGFSRSGHRGCSIPIFRAQASSSAFGTSSLTPAFGTASSTLAFGTASSTPTFATSTSASAFETPTMPSFATGLSSSLFATPFSSQPQQQQQQQLQTPLFRKLASSGFSFQTTPFAKPQPSTFPNAQLTTLMTPMAPLPFSLSDRYAIVDSYKDEPGNSKYAFKHLLFSVTDPQFRVKPAGVSDIMWVEAMGKLEVLDRVERDHLWPQLIQGFKDLSQRLKLQDEVLVSDAERLRITQSNVKMLQRHFRVDALPRIERMRQKEQGLQRRLLWLKGSGAEVSKRLQNLLSLSRVQVNGIGAGGTVYLSRSTKIDEQSFADMQEVLQQQKEAIVGLGNILKRDVRDVKIIMAADREPTEDLTS